MSGRRFAPLPDESLDALVTVLDEIRLGRSLSRSELVARTGLGRAIVAQRVGELIERGLVAEGDVGPSTGGRPPRQLTFRSDAGHVLVADQHLARVRFLETGDHSQEWLTRFAELVSAMPEVMEFYRMAGDVDYMLRVAVSSIQDYDGFYKRLIASIPLKNVTSRFAMERIKQTTALPIPSA